MAFRIFFIAWHVCVCLSFVWIIILPFRGWHWLYRFYLGGILWGLRVFTGITHEWRGLQHIPPAPFILASKHQSAFETFALPWLIPSLVFVVKQELLNIPVWGWFLGRTGAIGLDRGTKASALKKLLRQADARAKEQRPFCIFPQGTRTEPGAQRPYKPGVAALYAHLGWPVVPLALNSGLAWPGRGWPLPHHRGQHIVLEFLPVIPAGLDRETMMQQLEHAIETKTKALEDDQDNSPSRRA
ncbi:MAG: 1-acyl-sn-glycerol-3-phosphate acyltransferase [Alphaproteobacteria bacterium]|nr:1-acyl-sn-glycerol-3-phosphate acyltransferase [Alphaproteobacteria bacterium]NDC56905.1 1-acyl-sn-glycerol-3-phosphate acyltransferase [Alphaproteobacteria bacterium]NDG05453.1 1-acyl-sn-glycerol-3-phosphate acyltransferase [Alphaproteobacteria bacterium]